jgi:hypothetical protein
VIDAPSITEPLSRRQQKKQILRDIKQQRKGQKKMQKQTDAFTSALTFLEDYLGGVPTFDANGQGALTLGPSDSVSSNVLSVVSLDGFDDRQALASRLLDVFHVRCKYHSLPLAYGPSPTEGMALLDSILVRPPKYTAKFLPQEYSLLHKLWCLLRGDCARAGVVDVGAGNANCAVLAASSLLELSSGPRRNCPHICKPESSGWKLTLKTSMPLLLRL